MKVSEALLIMIAFGTFVASVLVGLVQIILQVHN